MRIKTIMTATCLVLLINTGFSQVYTLTPAYKIETWLPKKPAEIRLSQVDSFSRGAFTANFSNMTFTNPITILSYPTVLPIKKITDLGNNLFLLILKKDNKYTPDTWYLQLDSAGSPVYFKEASILHEMYTSTPEAVTLRSVCSQYKKVQVPYHSGERPPDALLRPAIEKAVFTPASNRIEVDKGFITWMEGKDQEATVHRIPITGAAVSTKREKYFIQLTGVDELGTAYNLNFYSVSADYPDTYHVYLEYIQNNTWTWVSFK